MARAAIRLKCNRDVFATAGEFASFSQASLTSAVGLSVALASLRLTAEAKRRSSSYASLNRSSSRRLSSFVPPATPSLCSIRISLHNDSFSGVFAQCLVSAVRDGSITANPPQDLGRPGSQGGEHCFTADSLTSW